MSEIASKITHLVGAMKEKSNDIRKKGETNKQTNKQTHTNSQSYLFRVLRLQGAHSLFQLRSSGAPNQADGLPWNNTWSHQ